MTLASGLSHFTVTLMVASQIKTLNPESHNFWLINSFLSESGIFHPLNYFFPLWSKSRNLVCYFLKNFLSFLTFYLRISHFASNIHSILLPRTSDCILLGSQCFPEIAWNCQLEIVWLFS